MRLGNILTAASVWSWPTRTLTDLSGTPAENAARTIWGHLYTKYAMAYLAQLDAVKAIFFKRGESLGLDGGDGSYTVTHGVSEAGLPYCTRLTTDAVADSDVYSQGEHHLCPLARMPMGGVGGRIVFEARAKLEQTAACEMAIGFWGVNTQPSGVNHAGFLYDASAGVNWVAHSYHDAEETTDTGVAADTEWHVFRIQLDTSNVTFLIDGTQVAQHTTQVPDPGYVDNMRYATVVLRTEEDAAKTALYEYVAVWLEVV